MYLAQPGHIDHIKRNNAGSVYRLIDQQGPISRIELSKRSQLAPASITKITRELMDAHLIQETQIIEPASRGRPAIGLKTLNEGWQFMSIRLGRGYLTIALHEHGGDLLIDERHNLSDTEQEPLLQKIISEINTFFARHVKEVDRVTSIAISLPGLINAQEGVVLQMPHYNIKNMPLGPRIHEATGLPVFIANDTHAWALAERLFGHSREAENSILISIHHGIGAGIVLDGTVLQGRLGNVGELGHIQIKPFGKKCFCGNYGCLETVASPQAVKDQVNEMLNEAKPAEPRPSSLHGGAITIERICEAAVANDPLARQVIIELGHNLGQAIAIMVNLFNPEKILIGGEFNRAKKVLYPAIRECIESSALPAYCQNLQLEESSFYTQATMPGAALVKRAMYDGSLLMKMIDG
ncbi:ROK family transcriptional regulator [Thaumasiovibrio sp. DFM-14]|uniref:sugar metabolism global transcriptional regulator Mlc n=1 Tax=Thaumasiovibrio sp. DFM-14 TaxID=3384792 RepID=UPI00399FBDEB